MHPDWQIFFGTVSGFKRFSAEHWIPLIIWISSTLIWIRWASTKSTHLQYRYAWWFSVSLAIAVLSWMCIRIALGSFDWKEDLPFHLCNMLALIFPVALYYRIHWFFGILYFWVLVGTLQAVITPDLKEPFPHFVYFRYWWIHCGLISLVMYGLLVLRWRIVVQDIKNALLCTNVYLLFSLLINVGSGGNYFFSMRKPDAATLLDYLGPWPWYLLTGQFVMLILFVLYFLPVYYWQKKWS